MKQKNDFIHIVLISPQIPQNTGNIIRLCANIGAELHLIQPLGFKLYDKRIKRAALDYSDLIDIKTYSSFEEYVLKYDNRNIFACCPSGERIYTEPQYTKNDSIIFGPEEKGIPKNILTKLQKNNLIKIPMRPNNRSINLSNTVAILGYEIWRQLKFQ
ncbi:MAG: tRNA (cytidine(34)-2'-O)-methyltransferase [SAR202 cluster bacterium]|nr:tRNA (cytidine(34)-2'-O)-methyltransferase [SAR202 cluster bacterium]|tara:strand:+ start:26193 stop:26666 length:474 start_codon:yes stop_codon:yes gene_type:complete